MGLAHGLGQPLGQRLGFDLGAHVVARPFERRGVLDVDRGEAPLDPLAQPAGVAEGGVGGGADDETGGDGEAGGGQLAEVGALAARVVDVLA